MRTLAAVSILLLYACRPAEDTRQPDASREGATTEPQASPAVAREPEPPAPAGCAPLEPPEVAQVAAELGLRKLEESRDGEHYRTGPFEEAMAALRTAAEQGHRGAQSLYGRTTFETHFLNEAPTPAEKADYVAAFTFLRIAALRGDPATQDYLPGLAASTPPVTEEPLDQLPAAWLTEAYARADAWMACHATAAGDRGVP